jgi:DNA-binding beta-propeller fold protein YncE
MGTTLSVQRSYSFSVGYGICVALKHGVIIVSDHGTKQLHMHSLADGSLLRTIGGRGRGKGQFDFGYGGLCVSPDGDSVLVAEWGNNRVQQVRVVDGSWVRFVGKGVLMGPECVDCNGAVIAVSENRDGISVFSWADGSVRARFGSYGSGPGQLIWPTGVRLLPDGSGLVVADYSNHRLCVFTQSGEFVQTVGSQEKGVHYPYDVLECASADGSFIVANFGSDNLVKLSRDGSKAEVIGMKGCGNDDFVFTNLSGMAALPGGAMLVRYCGGTRCSIFRDKRHRLEWIGVCVAGARV